jgi:hypothetical protein
MSIINSDGLNANWQLNVLRGLQGIVDQLANQIASSTNATIVSPLGTLDSSESVSAAIATDQFAKRVIPVVLIESGTTGSIEIETYSASFASNGSADALVSFDGGSTYVSLPSGTTLNMNAGSLGWYYGSGNFIWDTTTSGASLIITYNY